MGWQLDLLEATRDLEVTQEEVTGMVSGAVETAIQGVIIVGIMSMLVKEFYSILGPKKFAKQEEEVLEMVEEIW